MTRRTHGGSPTRGDDVRAQPGQRVRDGLRIARRRGRSRRPAPADTDGEEVLEIEAASRRRRPTWHARMRPRRAAGDEPVRRVVDRDPRETSWRIQRWISFSRAFGRSITRGGPAARGTHIRVVAQPSAGTSARARGHRRATRAGRVELEALRELADGVDPRQRPRRAPRRGMYDRPAQDARHRGAARPLLEHDRDVGGELARPVARRAPVGGEHVDARRPHPRPAPRPPSRPRAAIASGSQSPARKAAASTRPSSRSAIKSATMLPDFLSSCVRCTARSSRWAHAMRCGGTCGLPGEPPETHLTGAGSGAHRRDAHPNRLSRGSCAEDRRQVGDAAVARGQRLQAEALLDRGDDRRRVVRHVVDDEVAA